MSIIRKYTDFSIKTKMMAIVLIAITIMLVLSIVTFTTYTNWSIDDAIEKQTQNNEWMMQNLDSYINDLVVLGGIIHYHEQVIYSLESGVDVVSSPNEMSLEAIMNSTLFTKDYINSIIFFDANGNSRSRFRSGEFLYGYNPSNEEWYQSLIRNEKKHTFFYDESIEKFYLTNKKSKTIFSIARQIFSVEKSAAVGVMLVNIDIELLNNLVSKANSQEINTFSLILPNGHILYDSDPEKIGGMIDNNILSLIKKGEKTYKAKNIENHNSLYTFINSDITGCTFICNTNLNALTAPVQKRLMPIILINIFVFFLLILAVIFILNRITEKLVLLIKLMREVENGNWDIEFLVESDDEIGTLANGFNSMISHIRYLIDKVYKTEIENKEAHMRALQRQINPHFIYNTLESIRMMAYERGDKEVSRMAVALGKLLRNSISENNKILTVREEIEHTKNYLYIQKVRFKDKLTIEYDIEEALYDYKIIKLILQPLIENAIKHGIEKKKDGGKILIRGYISGENIFFIVKDNGCGILEERLIEINSALNEENNGTNIGLSNVNKRIKLYYGEKYGLQIYGEKGVGAVSKIILPNHDISEE